MQCSLVGAACMQEALGLSMGQRGDLVRLRGVCLAALASIIEQRNTIHAQLTVRAVHPVFAGSSCLSRAHAVAPPGVTAGVMCRAHPGSAQQSTAGLHFSSR